MFNVSNFRGSSPKFERPKAARDAAWQWLLAQPSPERVLFVRDPKFSQLLLDMVKLRGISGGDGVFLFLVKSSKPLARSGGEALRVLLKTGKSSGSALLKRFIPWENVAGFEDVKVQQPGLGCGWRWRWYGAPEGRKLVESVRFGLDSAAFKPGKPSISGMTIDPALLEQSQDAPSRCRLRDLVEAAATELVCNQYLPYQTPNGVAAAHFSGSSYALSLGALFAFRLQAAVDRAFRRRGPAPAGASPPGLKAFDYWSKMDAKRKTALVGQLCDPAGRRLDAFVCDQVQRIASRGFWLRFAELNHPRLPQSASALRDTILAARSARAARELCETEELQESRRQKQKMRKRERQARRRAERAERRDMATFVRGLVSVAARSAADLVESKRHATSRAAKMRRRLTRWVKQRIVVPIGEAAADRAAARDVGGCKGQEEKCDSKTVTCEDKDAKSAGKDAESKSKTPRRARDDVGIKVATVNTSQNVETGGESGQRLLLLRGEIDQLLYIRRHLSRCADMYASMLRPVPPPAHGDRAIIDQKALPRGSSAYPATPRHNPLPSTDDRKDDGDIPVLPHYLALLNQQARIHHARVVGAATGTRACDMPMRPASRAMYASVQAVVGASKDTVMRVDSRIRALMVELRDLQRCKSHLEVTLEYYARKLSDINSSTAARSDGPKPRKAQVASPDTDTADDLWVGPHAAFETKLLGGSPAWTWPTVCAGDDELKSNAPNLRKEHQGLKMTESTSSSNHSPHQQLRQQRLLDLPVGNDQYAEVGVIHEYLSYLNAQNRAHHERIQRVRQEQMRLSELSRFCASLRSLYPTPLTESIHSQAAASSRALRRSAALSFANSHQIVCRISGVLAQCLPGAAHVQVYGSVAVGLHLPSSDLDVLVQASPDGSGDLPARRVTDALRACEWVQDVKLIAHAKVPVIKAVCLAAQDDDDDGQEGQSPGLHIDLTFAAPGHSGLAAAQITQNFISSMPRLRSLMLLLKRELRDAGLANPYKGGLGSYALLLMAAAAMQDTDDFMRRPGVGFGRAGALAEALVIFLETFGNPDRFNPATDLIVACPLAVAGDSRRWEPCVRHGGKRGRGSRYATERGLVIVDPNDASNNVGAPCFLFHRVQGLFAAMLKRLRGLVAGEATGVASGGELEYVLSGGSGGAPKS